MKLPERKKDQEKRRSPSRLSPWTEMMRFFTFILLAGFDWEIQPIRPAAPATTTKGSRSGSGTASASVIVSEPEGTLTPRHPVTGGPISMQYPSPGTGRG